MSAYRIRLEVTARRTDSILVEIPDGLTEATVDNLIDAAVVKYHEDLDASELADDIEVETQTRARHLAYSFAPEPVGEPVWFDVPDLGRWATDGAVVLRDGWALPSCSGRHSEWKTAANIDTQAMIALVRNARDHHAIPSAGIHVDSRMSPVLDAGTARASRVFSMSPIEAVVVLDAAGEIAAVIAPLNGMVGPTYDGRPVRVVTP